MLSGGYRSAALFASLCKPVLNILHIKEIYKDRVRSFRCFGTAGFNLLALLRLKSINVTWLILSIMICFFCICKYFQYNTTRASSFGVKIVRISQLLRQPSWWHLGLELSNFHRSLSLDFSDVSGFTFMFQIIPFKMFSNFIVAYHIINYDLQSRKWDLFR